MMKVSPFILKSLAVSALILLVGVALVLFQMSTGSLGVDFLKQKVGASIASRLPDGSRVDMEEIAVAFADDWSVQATVHGLAVDIPQRGNVQSERLDLTLSAGDLFLATVRPTSVKASGVTISVDEPAPVVRSGSRAEFFGMQLHALATWFRAAGSALADRSIDHIEIDNASVGGPAIERTGLFADNSIPIAGVDWRANGGEPTLSAVFQSEQGTWQFQATPGRDEDGLDFVDIEATDFPPAFVFPRLSDPDKRPYFDASLTMKSRILSGEDKSFQTARTFVSVGSGYLSLLENDASIIDRVDIALELTAGSGALKLARGDVHIGGTHVAYRGTVDLSAFGEPMTVELELGPSRLVPHEATRDPVILDVGKATGHIDLDAGEILLDDAFVTGSEGQVRAAGAFRWKGSATGLSGALTIEETTARMARALWLPFIANKTRTWFDQNVKSGVLGPGTVQIALPMRNLGPAAKGRPLPPDGVVGSVPYQFGQFTPLRDLPLVRNAFGSVNFADATVTIGLERADVSAGRFGVANVGPTRFWVPNLGRRNPVGNLDLNLTGPAAAVAFLSDAGRLNIAEERGIAADALTGEAEVDLDARFALTKPARAEDIDAEFDLALSDFASSDPIRGQLISGADLRVRGNVRSYTINGIANIDGIPADIDLSLGTGETPSSVKLTMDAAARQKLGIKLESFISGDVIASVDPNSEQNLQEISVDLTPARIELPFAGWQKGAGVSAIFSTLVDRTGEGTKFRDIILEGNGFKAAAEVAVDEKGNLTRLDAKGISLKPGDNMNVLVEGDGNTYRVTVSGSSFDARGLIDQLLSSFGDGAFADERYEISLDLEQVRGFNNVSVGQLNGNLTIDGGRIQNLQLQAATESAQPLRMVAEENDGGRFLELTSGNGGAILRFLNIYTRAFGGDLRFRFREANQAGNGSLVISNFRVQNERALSDAARERIRSISDNEVRSTDVSIDVANLNFARLHIPFRKNGPIVTVSEGVLFGPTVGATGRGTLDLKGQNLALSGTIVPAYGINNIPGAIPIIGQILGGRKREGLIGITYQMYGPLKSPTLKLNPASAIAPGIFRRIFEFN